MISHRHKCVFIHIPKCGGQSIETIFLREHGLSWDERESLLLRANRDPGAGPPRLAHLTCSEYLEHGYISPEAFFSYTVFSVVRNPYKRIESLYRYFGYDRSRAFSKFVTEILAADLEGRKGRFWFVRPQYDYLVDADGRIRIDHLIRLEDLRERLPDLLERLGIRATDIPHVNRSADKRRVESWRNTLRRALRGAFVGLRGPGGGVYWDAESIGIVNKYYRQDFRAFGYEVKNSRDGREGG